MCKHKEFTWITKIYYKIIDNRQKNPYDGYTEKHHIVPRSLGGSDKSENIVKLTAKEHYICHLLLTKMYNVNTLEYYKMVHAFYMMCNAKSNNQNRLYKVNSRSYKYLKESYSVIMKKTQSGELNSQFGSKWVYNPSKRLCKKINAIASLEDGWFYGRVQNWDNHYTQKRCDSCNKIGLMSPKSKYCSVECKNTLKRKNSFLYLNKDEFKKYYLQYKSINKAIKLLGKCGGEGAYHAHAIDIIQKDIEMHKIYLENKI